MRIHGNTQQREELGRAEYPTVVLLRGPSGVGKWLSATDYADRRGGAAITLRHGPKVDDAREMVELFRQRPALWPSTIALVDLDECSWAMQSVLLKTIEELPSWGVVIMVASHYVLPTIRSRVYITLDFAPLEDDEIMAALTDQNATLGDAEVAVKMAGGSVGRALRAIELVKHKPVVLQYLDAVARVDRVALTTMLPRWTDEADTMLWRWITEVLSDWPQVFTKAELGIVHKIGVSRFYVLLDLIKAGYSPDLAAMTVWKMK